LGHSRLRQSDSTEYWWPSTSSPSGSRSSRPHAPRLTEYSTSWMNSYIGTDYPIASSQTWAPISTITNSESTARTARSTSGTSQLPILGPLDKLSAPMGWCSTLLRSGYTTLPTPKDASGSRNYPMRSRGYALNPPSQRDNRHTSWSTAPKQSSLLMSCGTHQQ
jgi:hypothetical protein